MIHVMNTDNNLYYICLSEGADKIQNKNRTVGSQPWK